MFIGGSQRGHRRQSYSKDDKKTEGIETEGLELAWSELPPWEESKIVILPVVSIEC